MNLWALAAIAVLFLAIYLPPLREALRFAWLAPSDLIVSIALALLLVAPAELKKAFVA
jgi:Ca2+-transporting ATPase